MCGIAALFSNETLLNEKEDFYISMRAALLHRGPDDQGTWSSKQIILVHTRLSIIDLSTGKQPFFSQDGQWVCVFNGEIFNYQSLKQNLESKGLKFKTQSDCEVLLEGFVLEGESFLSKLEGMFSVVMVHQPSQKALCFRDGFGVKPLYYHQAKQGLMLCSEIKPILKHFKFSSKDVSFDSLWLYFNYGFNPSYKSPFVGIKKIEPGVLHEINHATITPKNRFFNPKIKQSSHDVSENALVNSIQDALVSDVEVGLFLSAGIDSSLIASIVSLDLGKKIQSFSMGFKRYAHLDESPQINHIVKKLSLPHTHIDIDDDDLPCIDDIVEKLEEPLCDPSAFALDVLCNRASKTLKVVLAGDGGDELYGGYPRYQHFKLAQALKEQPALISSFVIKALKMLNVDQRKLELLRQWIPKQTWANYLNVFCLPNLRDFIEQQRHESIEKPFAPEGIARDYEFQWYDLQWFLGNNLMVKSDHLSMAHSLEIRLPFLQTRLLESSLGMSPSERSHKSFLRKMLKKRLGSNVANLKKKGFEMPLGQWLSTIFKKSIQEHLSLDQIQKYGFFRADKVDDLLKSNFVNNRSSSNILFRILLIQAWLNKFANQL